MEQCTWALSVLIRTLLPECMAYGHAKVETSRLLLRVLVACTLVELHQAFRRRKPQRWACRVARVLSVGWFRLIQDLDASLVVFLRGTCSGLGPAEGGRWNCVWTLLQGRVVSWQGICQSHTLSRSGCASHRTYPVSLSPRSEGCKPTPVSTSQAQIMGCSLLSIGRFPHDFTNFSGRSIDIVDGGSAGQRNGTSAAPQRGHCQGPGPSSTAVELETAKGSTAGKYLWLFCCQRSSFRPVPGQASSVSRCTGA